MDELGDVSLLDDARDVVEDIDKLLPGHFHSLGVFDSFELLVFLEELIVLDFSFDWVVLSD